MIRALELVGESVKISKGRRIGNGKGGVLADELLPLPPPTPPTPPPAENL
jgi:hypothetical protein